MNTYAPGARIAGRYEVASHPLMGGMGIVYICFDHQEQRPVALKTFKPEYLPDRAARDRFLREGTTWVDLGAHSHVVRAYSVERIGDGREVYLVLELIAKEQGHEDASLRSWLTPGQPLPVEQALLFALQIARGMKHAAEKIPGLVHRDLKPENVLVGADKLSNANVNRLRVTDFGLASVLQGQMETGDRDIEPETRNMEHALRHTQLTHGIVGTPLYMAPEQWRGEPVGVYTDVYALGCILYEMLTGRRAVDGRSIEALRQAHCAGQVCPLPGRLPPAVSEIVGRCLMVEARERYSSCGSVEVALAMAYRQAVGQTAPEAERVAWLGRGERVAAGWSYSYLGFSYLDVGKPTVAIGYFDHAVSIAKAEDDPRLRSAALDHLGIAYKTLGDMQRAIKCLEQALAITRDINAPLGEANALGNLGNVYERTGNLQRAIECHRKSLAINRQIGNHDGEVGETINLGRCYALQGDHRQAIGVYEEALKLAHVIKNLRWEATALNLLGRAYENSGSPQQSIEYHEQSLSIARQLGDRDREAGELINLGICYFRLDNLRLAVELYQEGLEIAREVGHREWEGNALGNLGSVYLQLGDVRRAIGYYEQTLVIDREIGDRRGEGNALCNLGSAYADLGEARRAIEYYEQALAIRREIGDVMGIATDSFNMALLYVQQGEAGRALPLAQEAARIWAQIGSPYVQQAQQLATQLRGGR